MTLTTTVWVASAWCAGLVAGVVLTPGSTLPGLVALLLVPAAIGAVLVVRPLVLPLALAAALVGLARAELPVRDPTAQLQSRQLVGTQVAIRGEVIEDPVLRDGVTEILIRPSQLRGPDGPLPVPGSILIRDRGSTELWLGDWVETSGRLALPAQPPGFDRRAYLARKGAYLEVQVQSIGVRSHDQGPRRLPGWLRDRYREAISTLLPEPHASVLTGVVLGVRSGIPAHLKEDLIATGLIHLLVLSGLKVAVFARLATAAMRPLLGRASAPVVVALVGLYALAGGATPASVRAAVMGCLTIVALTLGRRTHVWTSLSLAAAAMLGWDPQLALDVGFQLSFAGTAAIVLLSHPLAARLGWLPERIREPFAVTCAAQLGTLPLMATDFHLISISAPITNALLLPLLPAMIGLGLLVAPLALLPALGRVLVLPLAGLLIFMEQAASLAARLPAASIPVASFPPWAGLAYYLSLTGAIVAGQLPRRRMAGVAIGLLGPGLIGGSELAISSHVDPHVLVLSVGEGQAVLVAGPQGQVLIDGGPSPSRLEGELGLSLPPWRRDLDGLLVTAPSPGHVGGLAGFEHRTRAIMIGATDPAASSWRTSVLQAQARGATLARVWSGQIFQLAGFSFEVLAPEPGDPADEPGAGYLAVRVSRLGGPAFCDLSDLDPQAQVVAAEHLRGPCNYLLLPAAGRSSPAPELLGRAQPRWLVASTSGGRLARDLPPANLRRTDQEGTISLPM